jgi:hypothetical protein
MTRRRSTNRKTNNTFSVEPDYMVRFISHDDRHELVNFYHLARTALSGESDTPYDRMIWASKEFAKRHGDITPTAAYKDLCGLLGR